MFVTTARPTLFGLVGLGLLLIGCQDVTVPSDVDVEPGINLPPTTSESDGDSDGDQTDPDRDSDGDSDPERADETGETGGADGSTGEPSSDDNSPPSCNDQTFELNVEPAQVVLLLDKSYSMVDNQWDHDGDDVTPPVTRWNSLYNVVDSLTHDVEAGLELGMVLFPTDTLVDNGTATACTVESEPHAPVAPNNADEIIAALPGPNAQDLYGGTPVSGGMMVALEHLSTIADGREQAVILVTDGAANCMDGFSGDEVFTVYDENLRPLVEDAAAEGVPTYVVGVDIVDGIGVFPADNPYVRLNELAVAGGVPQIGGAESFYNTTDQAQLLEALDGIVAELGCNLQLDTPATTLDQITIEIDGEVVPRVEQCTPGFPGWHPLSAASPYNELELCAASCQMAQADATVELELACLPEG